MMPAPSFDPAEFWELLQRWKAGTLTDEKMKSATAQFSSRQVDVAEARIDLDRLDRCGAPEVVYGPGKSSETLLEIFEMQLQAEQSPFATRVTEEQAAVVLKKFPHAHWNPIARTVGVAIESNSAMPVSSGKVVVVTAGTSDRPVAEEAAETARWLGCEVELQFDLGVAGPKRLLEKLPILQSAAALVVVAGMEGALPSVVAGWVAVPVIAVPTSVGYGANLSGLTPVLTMLSSCAANVAVVNIDAGFKGGYLAGLIARSARGNRTRVGQSTP